MLKERTGLKSRKAFVLTMNIYDHIWVLYLRIQMLYAILEPMLQKRKQDVCNQPVQEALAKDRNAGLSCLFVLEISLSHGKCKRRVLCIFTQPCTNYYQRLCIVCSTYTPQYCAENFFDATALNMLAKEILSRIFGETEFCDKRDDNDVRFQPHS